MTTTTTTTKAVVNNDVRMSSKELSAQQSTKDADVKRRALLAKALGKKPSEVTIINPSPDEVKRTVVKPESFNRRNPFNSTKKDKLTQLTIHEVDPKEKEAIIQNIKKGQKALEEVKPEAAPMVESKEVKKPISKMTVEELLKIKGTISDVQWNKYYKMAGGSVATTKTAPAASPIKRKDKPASKPTSKPKEAKAPLFTCSEAIGIIMKTNPKATAEVVINKADTLYIKKTGKASNVFQMSKYHAFATHFLKGYNK